MDNSQYADGGMMTTKPYFSGSNYLRKMSDYPPGEWQAVWDKLFWRFISKYQEFFLRNLCLAMMARQWQKMDKEKTIPVLDKSAVIFERA